MVSGRVREVVFTDAQLEGGGGYKTLDRILGGWWLMKGPGRIAVGRECLGQTRSLDRVSAGYNDGIRSAKPVGTPSVQHSTDV